LLRGIELLSIEFDDTTNVGGSQKYATIFTSAGEFIGVSSIASSSRDVFHVDMRSSAEGSVGVPATAIVMALRGQC
jgi:hypothetical protein